MKEISLTQGMFALVDDDDFETIGSHRWHVVKMGTKDRPLFYAARNVTIAKNTGRLELMHRRILNAPKGSMVDHKNSNTLDNQKHNIRVCTQSENMKNMRSGPNKHSFRGVATSSLNTFMASIHSNGKAKYLGNFPTAEEAARAYDAAAIKEFGEFAKLNFPEGNADGLMAAR